MAECTEWARPVPETALGRLDCAAHSGAREGCDEGLVIVGTRDDHDPRRTDPSRGTMVRSSRRLTRRSPAGRTAMA
ncbi:hypothetical protein GCM10023320_76610 [Pseudonocardia adelaidensis]|uniref:Uncharacterized protein n=1 Tax=Pseudonocardia adelaidensis TaxID=648754 RepID=A0ABP9P2V3_9PSEU